MVAAICILGVFIYFYFWSRKLKKEQYDEWTKLGKVDELEQITAIIKHSFLQKKRFSPQYLYMELEATIYIPQEKISLKLLWKKPFTPDLDLPELTKKQTIRAFGFRRQEMFYANRLVLLKHEET